MDGCLNNILSRPMARPLRKWQRRCPLHYRSRRRPSRCQAQKSGVVHLDQRYGSKTMSRSHNSTDVGSGAQNAGAALGCSSSVASHEPMQRRNNPPLLARTRVGELFPLKDAPISCFIRRPHFDCCAITSSHSILVNVAMQHSATHAGVLHLCAIARTAARTDKAR